MDEKISQTLNDANCWPDTNTAEILSALKQQLRSIVVDVRREHDDLSSEILSAARAIEKVSQADQENVRQVAGTIRDLIVRLQFADRIYQRMANLEINLGHVAGALRAQSDPLQKADWEELLKRIQETFTMQEEREEFDQLMDLICLLDEIVPETSNQDTLLF